MEEKRLAVEDPVSCKRNLCRSIQAGSVYDYIADCLKTGYLYFGTIQTSLGPIVSKIMINERLVIQSIPGDIELIFLLLVIRKIEEDVCMSDWTLESWLATALVPRNMLNFSFDQVSEPSLGISPSFSSPCLDPSD